VTFALLGVGNEFVLHGKVFWELLLVAMGFPPYFLLRHKLHHDSLALFASEILIMQPVALALASTIAALGQ
jgi:chloramphenicol-sensitive protein RarD